MGWGWGCFFRMYVLKLISFLSFPLSFLAPAFSSPFSPPPSSLQSDVIHMVLDKLAAKDLGKVSRCPVKKSHQGVHFFPISSYYTTQLHSRGKIIGNLHREILG